MMHIWLDNYVEVIKFFLENFRGYQVKVEWSEPDEQLGWRSFSSEWMVNSGFEMEVTSHIEYWGDKARVPIRIVSLKYIKS